MEHMETIWDKRFGRPFLKIAAMLSMLCDHIGFVLVSANHFPEIYYTLRIIGRIAFPLFCFMLVEGFVHTHNRKNYIIRLAVFAIVSEIPFDLSSCGSAFDWDSQNVMWTLLIGFIVLCGLERFEENYLAKLAVLLAGGIAAYFMHTDYSMFGVFLIAVLYICRFNNKARIVLLGIMVLTQGRIEAFAALSIPFIMKYDPDKNDIHLPKYFFYVFYPAHLVILYLIHKFIII
jgi:hypothetical protein